MSMCVLPPIHVKYKVVTENKRIVYDQKDMIVEWIMDTMSKFSNILYNIIPSEKISKNFLRTIILPLTRPQQQFEITKDIKLTIENIYAVAEGEETATHVDFKERFGENEEHSEGEFTDETYRSESSEEDENSEEDSILSEISFKLIQQLDQWIEFDDYITTHKTRV
uniref:Uncharacterized protein n=1 Tax=Rhizophagus irregularis (strain DAOM 181602 / DAOM 197198 / MUCL 43194) TaxID=747089 RepID=U9TUC1_RHIID